MSPHHNAWQHQSMAHKNHNPTISRSNTVRIFSPNINRRVDERLVRPLGRKGTALIFCLRQFLVITAFDGAVRSCEFVKVSSGNTVDRHFFFAILCVVVASSVAVSALRTDVALVWFNFFTLSQINLWNGCERQDALLVSL